MKYIIFTLMILVGVPVMTYMAFAYEKIRGWMVSLMIFSTALGVRASINFLSTEGYRGPDRGIEITLTDIIALALILSLLMGARSKIKWIPYNSFFFLLFFLLAIISTMSSPEKLFSIFTLIKMVRLYMVYWCIINCIITGVDRKYVWYGFLGIGMYIGFITVKQKYLDGMYRVHGPFDHSNTIPAYVNLIMPSLFIWGLSEKKFSSRETTLSVLASLGLIFAVLATQSRAGLVLSTLCLLSMLFLAGVRVKSGRVYITGIIIIFLMIGGGLKASDTIINRFLNAPKESEEARDEFNLAAKKMAGDHLFGVGLNNFSKVLTENEKYNAHIVVMATEEQAGVVHHFYLLTSAEMGYPTLFVYVLIILRFMGSFLRTGRKYRSTEGLLLIGITAGAVSLHLTGFLEWVLRISPVSYQFIITSGFGVALVYELKQGKNKKSEETPPTD